MKSYLEALTILSLLVLAVVVEFGFFEEDSFEEEFEAAKNKGKPKAEPSEKTRGALGQGFEIHKIDLLSKQLQATGSKVFESLPHDKCTVTDKLGTTEKDDTFYSNTESLYKSVSTNSKVGASLQGAYTLGVSVSAITNNKVSGNKEVSGLSLNLKAYSMSQALKKECINKRPLAKQLVKDFENLDNKIPKPWLLQSWRKYKVFSEKYGSHIVKETISGSSIYQYVFAESSEKFSQQDFTVKACLSLGGPTQYGKVGVSACLEVSKKEIEESKNKSMVKKLVVRGGKSETRADLTGELTNEQINKFLKEGQTDPSPIQYNFYPIWTILKARYVGTDHFAKAVNLEQFYKGFLNFGCPHLKTTNGKELQKFELSADSDPEAPSYVCKLSPQGCHDDNDCHYQVRILGCSCHGESCVRYKDLKLNTGTTKKEAFANNQGGWGWQGCTHSWFRCKCTDTKTNWEENWSGDTDSALNDVHKMMRDAARRRDQNDTASPLGEKRCIFN